MCSSSLLQGIFPTQGSNPGLPRCRQILYQLSHKESPGVGWGGPYYILTPSSCAGGSVSILQVRKPRPRKSTTVKIRFEPRSASVQSTVPRSWYNRNLTAHGLPSPPAGIQGKARGCGLGGKSGMGSPFLGNWLPCSWRDGE